MLQPATSRGAALAGLAILRLVLGDKLLFDVDTAPGSRNAVWFDAMAGYKTVVRTQYSATGPSVENLIGWIGKVFHGFTVETLTMIT